MITAYCAIELAQKEMAVTWEDCPVLLLGWGRIGKCLGSLLKNLGAQVSIAARKETDLAMIAALGCDGREISQLDYILRRYRVIFNTVPFPVLSRAQAELCREDCVLVELASAPGIDAPNVIDGRGLPGKMAPESAGKLIARTVMGLWAREEETS
jgi:dipicolinate synthase subunit A